MIHKKLLAVLLSIALFTVFSAGCGRRMSNDVSGAASDLRNGVGSTVSRMESGAESLLRPDGDSSSLTSENENRASSEYSRTESGNGTGTTRSSKR